MVDKAAVLSALRGVIDPELGIDVVELGMVGPVEIDGADVLVDLRLTSMSCPFWELFVEQVTGAVGEIPGIGHVRVQFNRMRPWTPELMTDAARCQLEAVGLMPLLRLRARARSQRAEERQDVERVLGSPRLRRANAPSPAARRATL